jgi:hypothetical protein
VEGGGSEEAGLVADAEREVDADAFLDRHVSQILEHFDSVRIFVTRSSSCDGRKTTEAICRGSGNFYASLGYVREWVLVQDHRVKMQLEREDAEADG